MKKTLQAFKGKDEEENLRDRLVLLYQRLREMFEGSRAFGVFVEPGDLDEAYQMSLSRYPRLSMGFTAADQETLSAYAGMEAKDVLARATTPLERLAVAALWKQGDLGKVRYIAAGIVERRSDAGELPLEEGAPVFRQFGRHLADVSSQPIADQHTLRAYRYLLGEDLSDPKHRSGTVRADEVGRYVAWVQGIAARQTGADQADRLYAFDRSMFALGKATKKLARPSKERAEKSGELVPRAG